MIKSISSPKEAFLISLLYCFIFSPLFSSTSFFLFLLLSYFSLFLPFLFFLLSYLHLYIGTPIPADSSIPYSTRLFTTTIISKEKKKFYCSFQSSHKILLSHEERNEVKERERGWTEKIERKMSKERNGDGRH